MSEPEVTDTDRAKARRYWLDARYADDVDGPEDVIAQAIAAERAKARAPFLALADELEDEADSLRTQAYRSVGISFAAPAGEGRGKRDSAVRIRRTAKDPS